MDNQMKIYWKLYYESFSTETILRQTYNSLLGYEDEFIDGAIVDIGCGQTSLLLNFATKNRKLVAIDNEQMQLDYLYRRAMSLENVTINNWEFLLLNFPNDKLPEIDYSVIVLSNILHFFNLDECKEIGKIISEISKTGTLVYTIAHSFKSMYNNPNDPNNNDYFKHYFSIEDFEVIFPSDEFEKIYYSEIEQKNSVIFTDFIKKWIDNVYEESEITDKKTIETAKANYLKNDTSFDINCIFRKK